MRKPWLLTLVIVLAALLMSLALFAIACGGKSTTTTVGVTTTAGVTTTVAAPTTTVAAPTTTVAAPTTTVAASTTTVAAIDPAALFAKNCATAGCHKSVPSVSAATAKTVILSGRESMPSFKTKLSAAQIDALAVYVGAGGK